MRPAHQCGMCTSLMLLRRLINRSERKKRHKSAEFGLRLFGLQATNWIGVSNLFVYTMHLLQWNDGNSTSTLVAGAL